MPTELVIHIIQLALPLVRFNTFRQRYDSLLAFSLVSKEWNTLATRELWRHVYVSSETDVDCLRAALNEEPDVDKLGRDPVWTESLRGTSGTLSSTFTVLSLLNYFPRCLELWICPRFSQAPYLSIDHDFELPPSGSI